MKKNEKWDLFRIISSVTISLSGFFSITIKPETPIWLVVVLMFLGVVCYAALSKDGLFAKIRNKIGDWLDLLFDNIYYKFFLKIVDTSNIIEYLSQGYIDPYISCKLIGRNNRNCCEREYCRFGSNEIMTLQKEEISNISNER